MATTLVEEIQSVMNGKGNRAQKSEALIKLGLRPIDVQRLWFTHNLKRRAGYTAYKIGSLTFGVEIECFGVNKYILQDLMTEKGLVSYISGYSHEDSNNRYKLAADCSISGDHSCECVTPILKGKAGENSLKKACDALNQVGASVNRSCGLHVHFGAEKLSDAHYVRVFKNYQKCERVIDSFLAPSRRGTNNHYCMGLAGIHFENCQTKRDVRGALHYDRYYKVNAEAYACHKTIEFRQHQGTTDYKKIIMWVQFLRKLIEYSYKNEMATEPATIAELPFIDSEMKTYLQDRAQQLG